MMGLHVKRIEHLAMASDNKCGSIGTVEVSQRYMLKIWIRLHKRSE